MSYGLDSDDELDIVALEQLLGSSDTEIEEIEKNVGELDEADTAFFDQLGETDLDMSSEKAVNEPQNGTATNQKLSDAPIRAPQGEGTFAYEFTEPDESYVESNALEEQMLSTQLNGKDQVDDPHGSKSPQNVQPGESDPTLESEPDVNELETADTINDPQLVGKDEADVLDSSDGQQIEGDNNSSSLSQSIDVFSKLLPSRSVENPDNLTMDLQATAEALAKVSPNFQTGKTSDSSSGFFGRFQKRRSAADAVNNDNDSSTKEDSLETDQAEGEAGAANVETSPKASSLGFFSVFRASPREEENEEDTTENEGEGEEARSGSRFFGMSRGNANDDRETTNTESAVVDEETETERSSGFFGIFQRKSNDETKEDTNEKGSDDDKEQETETSTTEATAGTGFFGVFRSSPTKDVPKQETPAAEDKSGSTGPASNNRILNVFRMKFNESNDVDKKAAMNISPFEETDTEHLPPQNDQSPQNDRDGGTAAAADGTMADTKNKGVFGMFHRKREEWNRRGTIDFPTTGPYSERTVRVGKQLAQGTFATVFHATHYEDTDTLYVLKRINVLDDASREACEKESIICNVLSDHKDCVLPMIGFSVDEEHKLCYMLFPFMHLSLRAEMNGRLTTTMGGEDGKGVPETSPWEEKVILDLFYHLLHATEVLHDVGYSHRSIEVDNIYLSSWKRPVLSGFRHAGPITRSCQSPQDIFAIANAANQSTTMAYRAPELFPGALMVGHPTLDYRLVDCWSLGCTLFAMLFGASPFECTFDNDTGAMVPQECQHLSILADLPLPPSETPPGRWYSQDLLDLCGFILEKDRTKRPSLAMIQAKVSSLLTKGNDPNEVPEVEELTSIEDFQ